MRTFMASPGFMRSFAVPGDSDAIGSEVLPDGHTLALVDDRIGVHLVDLETGASKERCPDCTPRTMGYANLIFHRTAATSRDRATVRTSRIC